MHRPSCRKGSGAGDSGSVIGDAPERVGYSQSDRLRRRGKVFGSVAGASEVGSLLSSGFDYKSQDEAADMDDMKSQYAGTQSGVTAF